MTLLLIFGRSQSIASIVDARSCCRHPRSQMLAQDNVDGRDKPGHDESEDCAFAAVEHGIVVGRAFSRFISAWRYTKRVDVMAGTSPAMTKVQFG